MTADNRHLAKAERGAPSVEIVQALLESENEVDALRAEVRRLLTLGQGQRTLDLLARYEALLEEHADCLTVAHQQESELEQTETRVADLVRSAPEDDNAFALNAEGYGRRSRRRPPDRPHPTRTRGLQ